MFRSFNDRPSHDDTSEEPFPSSSLKVSHGHSGQQRYRTQRRGGKGLRDIKTTARNGSVVGIVRVHSDDELIMISSRGKLQRIAVADVSTIGHNTQGVRIMGLDKDDTVAAVVRVPKEENGGEEQAAAPDEGSPAEGKPADESADHSADAPGDAVSDES